MISDINVITEFTNDGIVYGVYSAAFKGAKKVFVRNGDSVGVVTHFANETANKCVAIIRDDVKQAFLSSLSTEGGAEG